MDILTVKALAGFFVAATLLMLPASAGEKKPDLGKIFGRIQVVDSFPDYKVKVVTSFPDLKVKKTDSFADGPGLWMFVESFPDFKIQFVDAFPDFTIEYVDAFPGLP
jgi:hypothetical protein